jgi:putative glutamine amidotransferase
MSNRPLIGVVCQTVAAEPPNKPAQWSMSHRYLEVLRGVGATPILIPLFAHDSDTLRDLFDRLDGLCLAGGSDIHPSRYGELPIPALGPTDPDRDSVELLLAKLALDAERPLFAICRGHQVLNVACGGTLYQDIPSQVPAALKHDYTAKQGFDDRVYCAHELTITSPSRLSRMLNTTRISVNSIHHQAIKDLGRNLTPTAYTLDGIIEAVEGPGRAFCVGVQWHPEELVDDQPDMRRLFAEFVAAAKGS